MDDSKIFIVGANGQLGTALRKKYPNARFADIDRLDITNADSVFSFNWIDIDTIINAAAYTNVDSAETPDGRIAAWKVNAKAVGYLAEVARKYNMTLVHISTDYVYDGTKKLHTEHENFAPLSVYGASKAAGDLLVAPLLKHYILRTSWVIGEGGNFVRTMLDLGVNGISPKVVNDQIGRLTFTSELVRAINHLLSHTSEYGTYNVSNTGATVSWEDIARNVFELAGLKDINVIGVNTAEYFAGKEGIAPRPLYSIFDLGKLHSTGFESRDWYDDLKEYIADYIIEKEQAKK
jgi:dTDP-4-dehydrorhamnose 3,5-epimerase/reductase